MKLKYIRRLCLVLEALILFFIASDFIPAFAPIHGWCILAAFILIGISAYLDYEYWRCPCCGTHLGRHMLRAPKVCPHCAHAIDLEEACDARYWRKKNKEEKKTDNEKHK
ncbi:MAG: hypothetical protein SOR89_03690 [Ndongobacter sp.]|nr:hypothetical protein [Ndongobacter sp.]